MCSSDLWALPSRRSDGIRRASTVNTSAAIRKRKKMSCAGEIVASAIFDATNEAPKSKAMPIIAASAAHGGGERRVTGMLRGEAKDAWPVAKILHRTNFRRSTSFNRGLDILDSGVSDEIELPGGSTTNRRQRICVLAEMAFVVRPEKGPAVLACWCDGVRDGWSRHGAGWT